VEKKDRDPCRGRGRREIPFGVYAKGGGGRGGGPDGQKSREKSHRRR